MRQSNPKRGVDGGRLQAAAGLHSASNFPDPRTRVDDPNLGASIANRSPRVIGNRSQLTIPGGTHNEPLRKVRSRRLNPFEPYSLAYDSEDEKWSLKVYPGWVIEVEPIDSGEVLFHHMPKYGGTELNVPEEDRPRVEVVSGNYVYLKFTTNDLGKMDTPATIAVSSDDKTSTHYIPPKPEETSGTNGEYWHKLFRFEIDGDKIKITTYQQSDVEWYPYVWAGVNVGDSESESEEVGRVYKQYNKSNKKHEFRTIVGLGDIHVTTVGDQILIEWCVPE